MKAKELAAKLLEYPEYEVLFSVDISVCEGDAGVRAFGEDVVDTMFEHHRRAITVCSIGELNYSPEEITDMRNKDRNE